MDSPELLRLGFADLHKELREDTADLEEAALFWQPAPGVNHIGFLLWHVVRDEDSVMCQAVRRTPELWTRDGWAEQFGMDRVEQGTGMDPARLDAFRFPLQELFTYATAVWSQTDEALASLPAERLGEGLTWSDEWRLANLLLTGCLAHGWMHLGEARQLRGLQGWRFRE
jgi:hypothetical protein